MHIIYIYKAKWEQNIVNKELSDHTIVYARSLEEVTKENLEKAEVLSIFVNQPIGEKELATLPQLKLLTTRSTGFDHIDIAAAKKRNIAVTYVSSYGADTVAEFVFALLLTLSRKVYDAYDRVLETGSFSQKGLRGFDLKGKILGVVGTGSIGSNVVNIAKGFGMHVIAYDVSPKEHLDIEYLAFNDLLNQSDIITFHAPHTDDTHHMLHMGNIDMLKKGCYIINTARGGLIETKALVEALEKEIVAGAGLDVLEEEGYLADEISLLSNPHPKHNELQTTLSNHYLIDHPRVIITPHNAFNTTEAIMRIMEATFESIRGYQAGNIIHGIPVKQP